MEFEDALSYLTAREDLREPIFDDVADRNALLEVVERGLERFAAVAYAYCPVLVLSVASAMRVPSSLMFFLPVVEAAPSGVMSPLPMAHRDAEQLAL